MNKYSDFETLDGDTGYETYHAAPTPVPAAEIREKRDTAEQALFDEARSLLLEEERASVPLWLLELSERACLHEQGDDVDDFQQLASTVVKYTPRGMAHQLVAFDDYEHCIGYCIDSLRFETDEAALILRGEDPFAGTYSYVPSDAERQVLAEATLNRAMVFASALNSAFDAGCEKTMPTFTRWQKGARKDSVPMGSLVEELYALSDELQGVWQAASSAFEKRVEASAGNLRQLDRTGALEELEELAQAQGDDSPSAHLVEKCYELAQVVADTYNDDSAEGRAALAEKMADVEVLIEQLCTFKGIALSEVEAAKER